MTTVSIVSIFTRGARSSETPELRTARVIADITRANEVWGTGFATGVSCGINFALLREFYRPDITINASTASNVSDPRIESLISETRVQTNDATAIYVVYLSGDTFSSGAVGNAGPLFENFSSTTAYRIIGRAALSDGAFETYLLAHEVGHVLFGRFLDNNNIDSFTVNDPSNPGDAHNNDPQNIMFPFVPAMNPLLNGTQCAVARQSRVILENAASTGAASGMAAAGFATGSGFVRIQNPSSDPCDCNRHYNNQKVVKRLNKRITCLIERMGPDKLNTFSKFPKKSNRDCDCD